MKSLARNLMLAAMLGGTAVLAAAPANARVSLSIGLGGPVYNGYNYERSCSYYRYHDLPAPARCLGYYRGVWGSNVYLDGNFVFQDRDQWGRWSGRSNYRQWHDHDWGGHDHGGSDHDHHR